MADPEYNLEEIAHQSKELFRVVNWAEAYARLEFRLKNNLAIDNEIHTQEILERRYQKHASNPYATKYSELKEMKQELHELNHKMQELRPKVWDTKDMTLLADHARMSDMNDRRKELEANVDAYLGAQFPTLKRLVPGIFDKILMGVDEETLDDVFKMMRRVESGQLDERQAFNLLADKSQRKYNLPKGFYKDMKL
jgi:hypothetical protein